MSTETDSLVSANISAFALVSLGALATLATMGSYSSLSRINPDERIAFIVTTTLLDITFTLSAARAWMDPSTRNAETYFKNVSKYFTEDPIPHFATASATDCGRFDCFRNMVVQGLEAITRAIENFVRSKHSPRTLLPFQETLKNFSDSLGEIKLAKLS